MLGALLRFCLVPKLSKPVLQDFGGSLTPILQGRSTETGANLSSGNGSKLRPSTDWPEKLGQKQTSVNTVLSTHKDMSNHLNAFTIKMVTKHSDERRQ